jgi:hypothetical protein
VLPGAKLTEVIIMPRSLGEVVAIEKAARQRANKDTGDIHKTGQKDVVFSGLSRTYAPLADDGVQLPPEGKAVQERAEDLLRQFAAALTPALDLAAAKDEANTQARGDVIVDGNFVLTQVPVSHLLFLEHQLQDVRTFVGALVTTDPAEKWELNAQTALWESAPAGTMRFERREVPLVLHGPTKEHPAQVKTTLVEQAVGTWTAVKFSGALSETRKREVVARVDALLDAVKTARERANQTAAPEVRVGELIFGYLFS